MAANIRHSSETAEHFSPMNIVEAARLAMGGIDVDPATTERANARIKAKKIFTKADNGFLRAWPGRVFLNPPGGSCDDQGRRVAAGMGQSSAKAWWRKLADQYRRGIVEQAVFVGFSLEILQTTQVCGKDEEPGLVPLDFPLCFPSRRVPYDREKRGKFVGSKQPPHASVIAFLPPISETFHAKAIEEFWTAFMGFGRISVPVRGYAAKIARVA